MAVAATVTVAVAVLWRNCEYVKIVKFCRIDNLTLETHAQLAK